MKSLQINIIFDLDGVLLEDNVPIPKIFNRLFEFAELIYHNECKKNWLLGNLRGFEIIKKIIEHIDLPAYDLFFKNDQERNLLKFNAELILVPEKLTSRKELDLFGFKFIKRCIRQNIRPLVLSNWDPHSFEVIRNRFSNLFALFDKKDIFISGELGFVKPEFEAFDQVIKIAHLEKERTIFIDDSPINIDAAQKYGIAGIHHQSWATTIQLLKKWGIKI